MNDTKALVAVSRSTSPAAAVARVGSPSTPLGETARIPPEMSPGMRSASEPVLPTSARDMSTDSGASASMMEVSVSPA